jgi:hypothetical protein
MKRGFGDRLRRRIHRYLTEPGRQPWPDPNRRSEPSLDDWILRGPRWH